MLRLRWLFGLVLTPKIPINTTFKTTDLSLIKLKTSPVPGKILELKNLRLELKKLSQLPFRPKLLRRLKPIKKKRRTAALVIKNEEPKRLKALP